jgi:adenosine deaminase/aminodeoxyfutalosine deaminase
MAAELHVHLEGSVAPADVGLDPVPFGDFTGFLQVFKAISLRLAAPEDYARITQALLRRFIGAGNACAEGIDYAEITLSAGVVLWKKQDLHRTYEAIRAVCASFPQVRVGWCFDAVRQFGVEPAMRVAAIAAEFVHDGVVSFGIGGDEVGGPAKLFGAVFARARRQGLRLTAHAGETAGPQSIWDALAIGAERIGHGIRAIDDAALLRHLRDADIPLEICITSNVATGVVKTLDSHPVRKLFDAGVPITLNTDDPGIFATSLAHEFEIARTSFGFTETELKQVAANAYRYAFKKPA